MQISAWLADIWALSHYTGFWQTCFPIHIFHSSMNIYRFWPSKIKIIIIARLDSFGNNVAVDNVSTFSTQTSEINEGHNIPIYRCRCLYTHIGDALIYVYAQEETFWSPCIQLWENYFVNLVFQGFRTFSVSNVYKILWTTFIKKCRYQIIHNSFYLSRSSTK